MKNEWDSLPPEVQERAAKAAEGLQAPHTVTEVQEMLKRNAKGGVMQTLENCMTVFQHDPILRGAVKRNLLTERTDIVKPLGWNRTGSTLTDIDTQYLLLYLEKNYGLSNDKRIMQAINITANENQYHPFRDLLDSLQWDGKERIRHVLTKYLGAAENEYSYECMLLFLLGLIERVHHPGCKFDYILCLVGGQGAGKSSFFRLLAIRDEWFTDDLKKLDDENVYRKIQGHVIIEMSEMLGIGTAKSTDEIKSFLSRQKETYKIPYEVHPEDRLRQCVFGGTTNRQDFLPLDRTGNRRFLPILVDGTKAETHILEDEEAARAYMLQVWAEAMVLYRKGNHKLAFPKRLEKELLAVQRECMPDDSLAGIIQLFLDNYRGDYVCTRLLYKEALKHSFDEPDRRERNNLNDIMNNSIVGWKRCETQKRIGVYGQQRAWERILDGTEGVNETKDLPDGFELVMEQMELPF